MPTGSGSLSSLREFNRLRIVDFLRTNGTASRAELARRTGLSRSTVSTLVADLQRRGLVVERAGQFAGEGQPGRPPALLALDPSAGAAVGVDFDHDKVRVAVSDLSRSVLAEAVRPARRRPRRPGRARRSPPSWSSEVLDEAGLDATACSASASRSPGPIDHDKRRRCTRSDDPARLGGRRRGGRAERAPRPAGPTSTTTPTSARSPRSRSAPAATRASRPTCRSRPGIGAGHRSSTAAPTAAHRGTAGEIGHVLVDPRARSAAAATAAAWRRWPPGRRCCELRAGEPRRGADACAR